MSDGQDVCVKVRFKAVKAMLEGRRIPYNGKELKTFQLLDNQHSWVPKLIDFEPDTSWLMREWFGDGTLRQYRGSPVPFALIESTWDLFEQAFAFFHEREEPWLIRDLKTQNIAMKGERLALFDFNTTMPISAVRNGNFPNRLGRSIDGNLYTPPELLTSNCPNAQIASDYFAFATLIFVLLTGRRRPLWTNKIADFDAAMQQYHHEYETEMPGFADCARESGVSRQRVEFLVASLHPLPDQRPQSFLS